MVHNRVNKWFTFWFEVFEAHVDHLLTLDVCFNLVFLAFIKKSHSPCRKKNISF